MTSFLSDWWEATVISGRYECPPLAPSEGAPVRFRPEVNFRNIRSARQTPCVTRTHKTAAVVQSIKKIYTATLNNQFLLFQLLR